jgi:hypothetical protein
MSGSTCGGPFVLRIDPSVITGFGGDRGRRSRRGRQRYDGKGLASGEFISMRLGEEKT